MSKVQVYIRVNNLKNSVHFLSQIANLFKVEISDDEMGEYTLSFRDNNAVKLNVGENKEKPIFAQGTEQLCA